MNPRSPRPAVPLRYEQDPAAHHLRLSPAESPRADALGEGGAAEAPSSLPVPELAANAVTKEQDLVETMRQSLADEKAVRDELAQKLSAADSALVSREQSLTQLQSERNKLTEERNAVTATLTETQRVAADLNRRVNAATQEATMTKEQLAQLQRELAEKQAEAERQKQALANLEKQQGDDRKKIEGLTMAVVVAEQEKKNLRETADPLKGQVEVERTERAKVQAANSQLAVANTQLAQGVGQLAEKSDELKKEIRENRPINANVLFSDFQANRVTASFHAGRKGFLGQVDRNKDANTVLVSNGRQVYALLHVSDTLFSLGENGVDWESMSVELSHRGGNRSPAASIQFLAQDPRIVVGDANLKPNQAMTLGAKVYPLAAEPFKFPEAVLIDGGGRGYGEVGFKLDPSEPGFVRVDNRLFKRLFGDLRPRGAIWSSARPATCWASWSTATTARCSVTSLPSRRFAPGRTSRARRRELCSRALTARVRALPLKLQ